jgi:hypothetical protein
MHQITAIVFGGDAETHSLGQYLCLQNTRITGQEHKVEKVSRKDHPGRSRDG